MYREEENKTLFLSEPSQVNKPIPRVNLSDNDSIMMFEWAKGEHNKNSDYERTKYGNYYKQHKWTLQINKSMAWSEPNDWNNHTTGVNRNQR